MKRPGPRPTVITDAPPSQQDQLRSRQRRYVTMMSVRAGCLVLGAVLIGLRPPLLGVWLSLCAVGMVFLPWAAVLIANDGPPKQEHRLATKLHRQRSKEPTPRVLPAETPPRVIDPD
ncbi:DUF3099 domain-containing protein [Rhizomonospora bruguierae]|uniref:DUF3099 domain-containing protein n=1 Tax=Rhizomonospora bruguierae TaxID=1581705 RepID=UPI001BCEA7EE|nr:DUF3099 domain-containing protein [Micromonospora sp. NBRC 107566]